MVPNSLKVLNLLAACQKYDMYPIQASIRAKIKRGEFPSSNGAEAFSAYILTYSKGLIPEMENAAHQTLDHPMTVEVLGEGLKLFDSCALHDLASFRNRAKDNLVRCLGSFLEADPQEPSSIWAGCYEVIYTPDSLPKYSLPKWLNEFFVRIQNDVKIQDFTLPLDIHSRIRQEFFVAFQNHFISRQCTSCLNFNMMKGTTYCAELEDKLKVIRPLYFLAPQDLLFRRYAVIAALLGMTNIVLGISRAFL